ncbi:protein TIFY 6b-like isoform X2 [Phoenix dactylifera]|uniref:Protein TIFY n=1 Tax=Phoenix dactylifera TaxID=42345 RepID=A0A8B7CPD7_PHODC|nr:protein TIFY 6b-like isoform X2 [Phoenix dactylifera]
MPRIPDRRRRRTAGGAARTQPISTVDAFEASHKSSLALAPQKSFSLDRQGIHQYGIHASSFGSSAHQSNEPRMFPVVAHHSIPVAMSSPFFKVQGVPSGSSLAVNPLKQQPFGGGLAVSGAVGGSVVGALAQRSITKPASTTAQLTIFYAGSVNVYNDVPLDKAQAIMLLASKGSNATSNAVNPQSEAPAQAPTKVAGSDGLNTNQNQTPAPSHVASPCSGLSSPLSGTSQTGPHSGSRSTANDDTPVVKSLGLLAPTIQNGTSKTLTAASGSTSAETIMPTAVPQARKASLARFLEKRKERVTNAAPYSCVKKSPENAAGFECADVSSKSSSIDIALSSNREDSWCLGQQKNSADSRESPSTKLEI